MRKAGLVVGSVVLVLSACGGGATTGASRSPSATMPSASTAALNCRIPISTDSGQQAGFLSIPSSTYMADPNAASSTTGLTYDWPRHRWLPVSWAQVLPDGSAYAYTRQASPVPSRNEIHVVDVATGTDRVVYNQGSYHVLAYQSDGIYVDNHLNGTDGSNGLWLLDPASGSLKAYPAGRQATWGWISAGGAWSYSLDGNRFGSNTFARLDLVTGTVETWFQVASPPPPEPGSKTIRVLGFDGSHPLVQVYVDDHTSEIWRLTAPGQATRLPDLALGPLSPPFSVADSHGIWLIASDGGVYLYANAAFTKVAKAPAVPSGWFIASATCA